MNKQIPVILTEDQVSATIEIITEYLRINGLRSYKKLHPTQQKEYAFIARIETILAKAKYQANS